MKYCKKCGLPEIYPKIQFQEDGTCNFCGFYEEHRELLENQEAREAIFCEQIEAAKKKAADRNAPYDCVVGISGGKDSTYIVYQLKHTYGMRVLAVTFQNGFNTDYSRRNIDNALEKLNVDHIAVRLNEQELRRLYTKSVSVLKNFCGVCFHFVHYYCHQIAGKFGIPLVVNGRTKSQILQSALSTDRIEPFEITHNLLDFEYQMFGELPEKLAQRKKVDYLEGQEVTSLSFFAYHDITEEETRQFLVEHVGWERPQSGVPHADCWAHAMAEHMALKKRGYPLMTGELAVWVRKGEMTKEEAAELIKKDEEAYGTVDPELEKRFYERIRIKKSEKN